MDYTMAEVLQFVEENDVKFIRLAFCDIFGNLKNISIMPSELPRAFESGISFDASAVKGFLNVEESDLFLVPDPATLSILPWRPAQGRVVRLFCDLKNPDGSPFEGDGRAVLRRAVQSAKNFGLECKIGSECEFYLFQRDENGEPTHIPHDHASYCDVAPLDKGENVRREICLTLEQMGIQPESSHHEQGPGQNEVDFQYGGALSAADNLVTFKSVVKTIAARNGLFASFLPKPFPDLSGSGLHINLSLSKNGINIFKNDTKEHNLEAESFIMGILDRALEMTAFLNPITNSYGRFGGFEAPKYVTWSHQNRSQLVRIPAAKGAHARMELRSADPSCNPYLAFALLIFAGLEGIKEKKALVRPVDVNLYHADAKTISTLSRLPDNLGDALKIAAKSSFIREYLPEKTLQNYLAIKSKEWNDFLKTADAGQFERDRYFIRI